MSMQDGTMIVAGEQWLINTTEFAKRFEDQQQDVIEFLGRAAMQGGILAYNEQGQALGRAALISDEDGYYPQFFINRDELRRYFADARGGESDLAYAIERVLDQI